MSGDKQHFVPQTLLKRFGVPRRKTVHVAVYTQDGRSFVTATEGIGAERFFYSHNNSDAVSPSLDDKITEYEDRLAGILERIHVTGENSTVVPADAAELTVHLVVRQKQMRESFSSAALMMSENIFTSFSDESWVREVFEFDADEPNEYIREALDEQFDKIGNLLELLGISRETFVRLMYFQMRQNLAATLQEIGPQFLKLVGHFEEEVPKIAKSGHNSALEQQLVPAAWLTFLDGLRWHVYHPTEMSVILPDCIAIASNDGENYLPLAQIEKEHLETVIVPIGHDAVLAGSRSEFQIPADLNTTLAKCSWDFFVAREPSEALTKLMPFIREATNKFIVELVRETLPTLESLVERGFKP